SAVALTGCSATAPASSGADSGRSKTDATAEIAEVAVGSVMGAIDGTPFDLRFERAQNSGDTATGIYPTIKIALLDAVASPAACIDARLGRALDIYVTNAVDTTALGPGAY